jgi:predicted branched-subunit amino acid permease
VAFAASIPLSWGLGFAGTLALIGVLFSLANSPLRALSAAISCAAAVAAFALPLRLNILVGIAAAVVLCMAIEQLQQSEPSRGQP